MSQQCKESITCPKCQSKGDFVYWSSINVDLDPEMKEKILNEEIFKWTCPHCGTTIFINYGTLYHDMSHRFMIFYAPKEQDDKKREPVEVPKAFGLEKDYSFREVNDLLLFKEKIMIVDSGLNDIAVEKLKYTLTHHMDSSFAEKGVELFFMGVTPPDKENKYGQITFYCKMPGSGKMSPIALPMQRYYDMCLSLELDKRFQFEGLLCVDQEWVSQKMKGVE